MGSESSLFLNMRTPSVTLTDAAAKRLKALSTEEGQAVMLRVAVDAGGCSGFQYSFDLVRDGAEDDLRIEREGAVALVDPVSLTLLFGSEIDYVDELIGAQFRVNNPNAKSSCGCGVSFSV